MSNKLSLAQELAQAAVTPGPWFIENSEPGWPITVDRWNPSGGYEYESMTDANGKLREFRSRAEAREAIAAEKVRS